MRTLLRWILRASSFGQHVQFSVWVWTAFGVGTAFAAVIAAIWSLAAGAPLWLVPLISIAVGIMTCVLLLLLLNLLATVMDVFRQVGDSTDDTPNPTMSELTCVATAPSVVGSNVSVTSYGQQGRQTAAQIINTGEQPRTVRGANGDVFRELADTPESVYVKYALGDGEAAVFADEITRALKAQGWSVVDVAQVVWSKPWIGVYAVARDRTTLPAAKAFGARTYQCRVSYSCWSTGC